MQYRSPLCELCEKKLEYITGNKCIVCSRESAESTCYDCERWNDLYAGKDPLKQNLSIYLYNEFMQELITKWKYRGDYIIGHIFQYTVMAQYRSYDSLLKSRITIVPIPLTKEREDERGFNQAQMIANFIQAPQENVLTRILNEKQSKKSRSERMMTNNPFKLVKPLNNPVLLVDDIYTTGRTLRHAAQLLIESGCPEVSALTICRG